MNISIKTTSKIILLLVVAIAFGFTANSCLAPPPPDEPASEPEPTREADSYTHKNSCEAEHTVGGTSCPQDVCSVPVYCGKTETSCTADSAVLDGQQSGLKCSFDNGELWTPLNTTDAKKGVNLNVEFTCAVAQSFERTYLIDFYKDGSKVDQQEFKVKMNVK